MVMKTILLTVGMTGGLLGCVLVALNQAFLANLIWSITNPCMVIHNLRVKEKAQAALWTIYATIALMGVIYTWQK